MEQAAAKPVGEAAAEKPAEDGASAKQAADQTAPSGVVADLQGLDIDTFFEESYMQLLMRDPELMTELGLSQAFGTGNDRLTDISDAYIRETQALEVAILDILHSYDRTALTSEQQLSYDIYDAYLGDEVAGHEFMYNDYPVTHFITGVQNQLIHFFTDIHPVTSKRDAEDYVTRLSQVDTKFAQLLEGLKLREKAGVILPKFLVGWIMRDLRGIATSPARSTPFYTSFRDKVNALSGLSDGDKKALLEDAEKEIQASVLPAFQDLVDYFEHTESIANNDEGVWKFPNGEAYYQYAMGHHTTTDMTAQEVHELGLQEVERVQAEMRHLFDEMGYPEEGSIPSLIGRVAQEGGSLSGKAIVSGYEEIIKDAEKRVDVAFDMRPKADVVVIGVPQGGFYVPPAVDGSRPGAFYATQNGTETKFSMPSLAYHEAVPGHHFQIAINQELDLPSFRKGATFTAYTEGWALYAELLAKELGFYEGDLYGDVGRLQMELFRAARLVVDTGIHAKRWSYDEAVDYLRQNTGLPQGMVDFEVSRYITWPGQALAYKVGMIEILKLRQRAMDQLGDQFDLKEFHNVVIGQGRMSLPILERVVDEYIEGKLGG
jgi:uncharacterized protein (DUF885 family)